MLYDYFRVQHEINDEALNILDKNLHWLSGTEEEISEARSQAGEEAKRRVAARQERDLLDMLYEWRQRKAQRRL